MGPAGGEAAAAEVSALLSELELDAAPDPLARVTSLLSAAEAQHASLTAQLHAAAAASHAAVARLSAAAAAAPPQLEALEAARARLAGALAERRAAAASLLGALAPQRARVRRLGGAALLLRALAAADELAEDKLRRGVPVLRGAMEKRLDAALVGLGWPGQVKARHGAGESDAMREVREAMVALLLLQHAAAAAGGGGDGGLWVLDRLVAPLLKRFRFHFETRRETNRRDKPEWVYSHCASLLRQHGAFLAESLQPVLLAPLPRLAALWVDAAAAAEERQAYVRLVGALCPQGVYLTVVGALCDAIHAKLMREMRGLLAHMPLYAHTLNETISFERELRATLKVPRYVPTALRAFHASADSLKLWLSVEASDGLAKLQQLAGSTRAWDSPGGEAADGGLRAPSCVVGAMKHLRHLVGRLELIDDAGALRRMLDEVMLPLLDQLLSHVRARAAVLMVNEHQAGRWVEVGRLLHAVDFCSPLLADWQEWEMFVLLAPPLPRAAGGEAAAAGVFARQLAELHELALELEAHAHETIQSHFETRCRPYVQERHRLRIDAPREAAVSLDVSPSFCAPILELRGELDGLRAAFPPPSLGRAWQAIAAGIDEMLAAQLLRHAHFSADGALQLRHDVHALLALFKPLTAKPHAAFPRLHESCLALTLAPTRRAQLMELLLAAPSDALEAEDATAGQLTAALEAEGIFHLKPTEIRELLSRVHGGED